MIIRPRKDEKGRNRSRKFWKTAKIRRDLARSNEISTILARSQLDLLEKKSKNSPNLRLLIGKIDGSVGSGFLDLRGDLIFDPPMSVFGERNPLLAVGAVGSVGGGSGSVGNSYGSSSWTALARLIYLFRINCIHHPPVNKIFLRCFAIQTNITSMLIFNVKRLKTTFMLS